MTTISSLWLMILIELLVVTSLATIVLLVLKFIRNGRDRKVAQTLINKIKQDGARRKAETKKLMLKKFGFSEEKAEEIAQQSAREEMRFYQNVINFYLRRDAVGFENLNIDFEGAVDAYRGLEPPGLGGGSASSDDGEAVDESEEISRLKIENKRLTDEVGVTMATMSRMLDEYSSMFSGGATDGNGEEAASDSATDDSQVEEAEVDGNGDIFAEEESGVEDELVAEFEPDVSGIVNGESEPETEIAATDQEEVVAESPLEDDSLVEEMDDLSDLEPATDDDLVVDGKLENPDELIG